MNSKAKITITEAVRLTGKHPDTIRAFLKKHGDKTTKDEKGRILIPYELIKNYYDVPEQTTIFEGIARAEERHKAGEEQPKKVNIKSADDELLQILKDELKSKNEQIAQQQKTIDDMQRTLTELVSQQQKLSAFMLTPKAENTTTEQESADAGGDDVIDLAEELKKQQKTATAQADSATEQAEKKGFFHWRRKKH